MQIRGSIEDIFIKYFIVPFHVLFITLQESPMGILTGHSDPPPLGFTNVSAILYLYEPV